MNRQDVKYAKKEEERNSKDRKINCGKLPEMIEEGCDGSKCRVSPFTDSPTASRS
ncbi:hypothetical protein QUA89_31740 [Microcoleus sp. F10-B4]